MKYLETIKEKKGYIFENGSVGKRWKRGRTMFSTGRKYIGNNEYEAHIIKTNLDTHEMEIASLEEHKRFLTPECYKKYKMERFEKLAKRG